MLFVLDALLSVLVSTSPCLWRLAAPLDWFHTCFKSQRCSHSVLIQHEFLWKGNEDCHHLLTLISFQKTLVRLWNTFTFTSKQWLTHIQRAQTCKCDAQEPVRFVLAYDAHTSFCVYYMLPWNTKPVIRVHFSKLRFIHHLLCKSWINKIVMTRYNYLKIWNLRVQKNLNIEKIAFKVVQMKFLAMHITNQKLRFDIFTVGNLQNIFMEHRASFIKHGSFKSTPALIFIKTVFDVKKCLVSRQGLSRRMHFLLSEYCRFLKM